MWIWEGGGRELSDWYELHAECEEGEKGGGRGEEAVLRSEGFVELLRNSSGDEVGYTTLCGAGGTARHGT